MQVAITHELCSCPPQPFRLFCFPGPKLYPDRRERWTKLMRRTTISNTKWHPKPSDRFAVIILLTMNILYRTPEHPDHSLNLGYNIVQTSSRRELFRQPLAKKKKHLNISNEPIPLLVDDDESVQCSSTLTSPPSPTTKFNITSVTFNIFLEMLV